MFVSSKLNLRSPDNHVLRLEVSGHFSCVFQSAFLQLLRQFLLTGVTKEIQQQTWKSLEFAIHIPWAPTNLCPFLHCTDPATHSLDSAVCVVVERLCVLWLLSPLHEGDRASLRLGRWSRPRPLRLERRGVHHRWLQHNCFS